MKPPPQWRSIVSILSNFDKQIEERYKNYLIENLYKKLGFPVSDQLDMLAAEVAADHFRLKKSNRVLYDKIMKNIRHSVFVKDQNPKAWCK